MSPAPPNRTPDERTQALAQALEARRERATLKQRVHDGDLDPAEVLRMGARAATDELGQHARVAGRIEIGDLLLAIKGVGPVSASALLYNAGREVDGVVQPIPDDKRLDQLSIEDRERLILLVTDGAEGSN